MPPRRRRALPTTWTTKEGDELQIADMEYEHLVNCKRMMERNHARLIETLELDRKYGLVARIEDEGPSYRCEVYLSICAEIERRDLADREDTGGSEPAQTYTGTTISDVLDAHGDALHLAAFDWQDRQRGAEDSGKKDTDQWQPGRRRIKLD